MRSYSVILPICIILTMAWYVQADIKTVPPGGTVFIGEEQLDISASGIGPGGQIAWWAPGTSLVETPADTVTVADPTRFSVFSSSFLGKEGIWYSLSGKTPILKIKQPQLKVRISDTTSDFDATGKWLPRGHLASFQIETNLYELRSRTGVTGAPIDIIIRSPQGGEYTAVSGPAGTFSLTGIPVSSALYDTGGIWNTGGSDSGTYTIRAECTANRLNSNNPDPGAGISETITVLIQDVNPLISGSDTQKKRETPPTGISPAGQTRNATPQPVSTTPQTKTPAPVESAQPVQKPGTPVKVDQTISPARPATSATQPLPSSTPTPVSSQVPVAPTTQEPSPTRPAPLPAILGVLAILYITRFRN